MAKQSKLDRAIQQASADYDAAYRALELAGAVVKALSDVRDSESRTDTESAPKAKRTRKPKGLPKADEVKP